MIDDGILQIVCILDRIVVKYTFQSGNAFVLDFVLSEYASLADNMDYYFSHEP
jgi:hypothetical protein